MKSILHDSSYSYFELNVIKYAKQNDLSLDQAALTLNRMLSEENESAYWKKRMRKDKGKPQRYVNYAAFFLFIFIMTLILLDKV